MRSIFVSRVACVIAPDRFAFGFAFFCLAVSFVGFFFCFWFAIGRWYFAGAGARRDGVLRVKRVMRYKLEILVSWGPVRDVVRG